jgi:hypothetical protein
MAWLRIGVSERFHSDIYHDGVDARSVVARLAIMVYG